MLGQANGSVSNLSGHPLLRVNALHALIYCRRLFYLEEVEELYTQDDAVFAGRRLHTEMEMEQDDEWVHLVLESDRLGMKGKVDALKTARGRLIPYEHKRGKCFKNDDGSPGAWNSDRIQILAYAMLLEDVSGEPVQEGRIRYHASNVTVSIELTEGAREEVLACIEETVELRKSVERPPITDNQKLCLKCSLAPVCLPEEARYLQGAADHHDAQGAAEPLRLFPAVDERKVLHIVDSTARLGRSGNQLKITSENASQQTLPIKQFGQIVIHGFAQVSTQALRMCADEDISVHYISGGGSYIGSFTGAQGSKIQRKIRQFTAFSDESFCLELARNLVCCRADMQRQVLMRSNRKEQEHDKLTAPIEQIQAILKLVPKAKNLESLRGYEGAIAAIYFQNFSQLLLEQLSVDFLFEKRNRRPPRDRVNALLSYGYSLLLKDVINAINTVGLEPAFGFYHQPRSAAPPLALDIMEIFRVLLVDIPVLNSLNRQQWDPANDFAIAGKQVWLSDEGKKKLVSIVERRKDDTWKHPVIGYSISYGRMIELEVRLLEKEWMNEGGLFARVRLR